MGVSAAAITAQVRRGYWRFFDGQLFLYMLLLIGFGVVIGYSVGFGEGAAGTAELSQVVRTVIWAGIGLTIYFVLAGLDYRWLHTFAVPIYLVVISLLIVTMLLGRYVYGAQMSVSVAGLDFQFSEISKVLMIVVLATYLSGRRERIGRLSTILTAAAIVALPTLLVFRQPDLGSAMVFVAILGGMLFMSGASLGWMGLIGGAVIAALPAAIGLLQ
ncbi:MAG: FtsW/RodA/SpoVE family cell cycle protein, partial [Candidatus Limnocylindria bacterium]